MNNVPQHAGRQPQQGLGAPQAAPQQQAQQNPYVTGNVALQQANGRLTGATQQREAQIAQASAQAGKSQAEAEMLQYGAQQMAAQQQGLGPDVLPQEAQASQLMEGIIRGQVGQEQLAQMVQAGEISPEVADSAVMQAQQFMTEDAARNEAAMGLGAI